MWSTLFAQRAGRAVSQSSKNALTGIFRRVASVSIASRDGFAPAPLDTAHVRPGEAAAVGERFLRHTGSIP
jgi:hypothetical protein